MRRLRFQPGLLLAFVLAANGLWLPLHFAVAHAPVDTAAATEAHDHTGSCSHHHHHEPATTADESSTDPSPTAPAPHDCDICDLLLAFSAAEVETRADAPPLEPTAEHVVVAPDRVLSFAPLRSLGARAPPIG